MVELIKHLEEEDEQWRRRSISTRPVMATHDRPPRETNCLTLRPGLGHTPGLKGVPHMQRGTKSFSPGLGDEPGPLALLRAGTLECRTL
jgi:hypothetical protein